MRLSDGQEADAAICRKIVKLFDVPKEPDFIIKPQEEAPQDIKSVPSLGAILGRNDSPNPQNMTFMLPGAYNPMLALNPMISPQVYHLASMMVNQKEGQ